MGTWKCCSWRCFITIFLAIKFLELTKWFKTQFLQTKLRKNRPNLAVFTSKLRKIGTFLKSQNCTFWHIDGRMDWEHYFLGWFFLCNLGISGQNLVYDKFCIFCHFLGHYQKQRMTIFYNEHFFSIRMIILLGHIVGVLYGFVTLMALRDRCQWATMIAFFFSFCSPD